MFLPGGPASVGAAHLGSDDDSATLLEGACSLDETICVPAEATNEEMNECHHQMQESLERARREAVAALGAGAS